VAYSYVRKRKKMSSLSIEDDKSKQVKKNVLRPTQAFVFLT